MDNENVLIKSIENLGDISNCLVVVKLNRQLKGSEMERLKEFLDRLGEPRKATFIIADKSVDISNLGESKQHFFNKAYPDVKKFYSDHNGDMDDLTE